jgi:hypothetical protein
MNWKNHLSEQIKIKIDPISLKNLLDELEQIIEGEQKNYLQTKNFKIKNSVKITKILEDLLFYELGSLIIQNINFQKQIWKIVQACKIFFSNQYFYFKLKNQSYIGYSTILLSISSH